MARQSEARVPRTTVGLWLQAGLREDSDAYWRLAQQLNRGERGWNDDEPAVVEAACELAVRRFFGPNGSGIPVRDFVSDMRRRISMLKTPPSQKDMEAVIGSALDNNSPAPTNIGRGELLNIRSAVTVNVSDLLKLDRNAIDKLIFAAEQTAIKRGYRPPVAADL